MIATNITYAKQQKALEEARWAGEATFTIEERLEELHLLVPLINGAMYSGAHIMKMYGSGGGGRACFP